MVAVQGRAYAIGGGGPWGKAYTGYTVEEYLPGEGWSVHEDMRLPVYLKHHCSVSLGRSIITIGGERNAGSWSTYAYEFDLDAPEKSWTGIANTAYGRQYHSCTVGSYQGQEGIFVTGGSNSGHTLVEFYVDSAKKWQTITAMSNGRHYHTSSFMNGSVYSLGGESGAISTYEKLSGGSWTATNLRKQRKYHASVSLPDKTLTCIGGDNLG